MMRWPSLAITGIGSVPFADAAQATRFSLRCDLPYLPERYPAGESLIDRALEGMARQTPPVHAVSALLGASTAPWVKLQLCGPRTLQAFGGVAPDAAAQWVRQVAAVQVSLVHAAGRAALFVVDEPGLSGQAAEGLSSLAADLKSLGVDAVGLHCCGQTDWREVLEAGFDVVSFDVGLSLDGVLGALGPLNRFLGRGGRLALGLVPPKDDGVELSTRTRAVVRDFKATFDAWRDVLRGCLLTPACGLGLQSTQRAEQVFAELTQAQAELRGVVG